MPVQNTTNISSIGLLFVILMGILIVTLPRRTAFVPLFLIACYVTLGQNIVLSNLNFTLLRIVLLFALVRTFLRGEFKFIRFGSIDKAVLVWIIANVAAYTILRQTFAAFTNRMGLCTFHGGFVYFFQMRDLRFH